MCTDELVLESQKRLCAQKIDQLQHNIDETKSKFTTESNEVERRSLQHQYDALRASKREYRELEKRVLRQLETLEDQEIDEEVEEEDA